jgi:hypothetical protein
MHGKLKGQFFILGSLLLCVILFAGLPAMVSPGASETGDLSVLSGNLETEVPMAVNLAMIEDGNPGKDPGPLPWSRDALARHHP